jgi:hypothetical protein
MKSRDRAVNGWQPHGRLRRLGWRSVQIRKQAPLSIGENEGRPVSSWRAMDEDHQADGVDVWPKPPGRVRAARFGRSRRL